MADTSLLYDFFGGWTVVVLRRGLENRWDLRGLGIVLSALRIYGWVAEW